MRVLRPSSDRGAKFWYIGNFNAIFSSYCPIAAFRVSRFTHMLWPSTYMFATIKIIEQEHHIADASISLSELQVIVDYDGDLLLGAS